MRVFCRTVLAMLSSLVPLSVVAAQTGVIAGRVTNAATGSPVPNANVRAFVGLERRASATTDDNGQYRLTGLAAGRYSVSVARVGNALRRVENVVVNNNQTTTLRGTRDNSIARTVRQNTRMPLLHGWELRRSVADWSGGRSTRTQETARAAAVGNQCGENPGSGYDAEVVGARIQKNSARRMEATSREWSSV